MDKNKGTKLQKHKTTKIMKRILYYQFILDNINDYIVYIIHIEYTKHDELFRRIKE